MLLIDTDATRRTEIRDILSGIGAAIIALLKERQRRRKLRNSLRNLSAKDLRDIGLILNDVDAVGAKPLACNAAADLADIARRRVGNW